MNTVNNYVIILRINMLHTVDTSVNNTTNNFMNTDVNTKCCHLQRARLSRRNLAYLLSFGFCVLF